MDLVEFRKDGDVESHQLKPTFPIFQNNKYDKVLLENESFCEGW